MLDPRVRQTALNMLKNRGYNVGTLLDDTTAIIAEREMLNDETTNESKQKLEQIIVFFSEETKIGITHIRAFIEEMKRLEINHAILIVKGTYTSSAIKGVEILMSNSGMRIELFTEKETRIDITEHSLQPKFKLLNQDEIKTLLNQYKIELTHLPRIKKTDPISRYYGAEINDVFKIIRPSETAGLYTNYRVVI